MELTPYKKFFDFGNTGNNWEPDPSTLTYSEGFDLQFRAEYETAEWNEQNHLILRLCHPEVRRRLEKFYCNNAHKKEIEHDAELTDWLGGGGLEKVPKCNWELVSTRKDFTAEKTQRLPYWFAQMLYADQQLPPEKQRVEWFDQKFPPSMMSGHIAQQEATAEDKALAVDFLALLGSTSNEGVLKEKVKMGKQHLKAGNLAEAQTCFRQLLTPQEAELLAPKDLANVKLLHAYSCYKLGIQCLLKRKFLDAAVLFEGVLHAPATISGERLKKNRLLHACSLFEAGKQHREEGDWGAAKNRFESAQKTKSLPNVLKGKNKLYLEECHGKCDDIEDIEFDGNAAIKVDGNEAFELYQKAKRSMERGDAYQAGQLFEAVKQHAEVPTELKKRAKGYIKELRKHQDEEATACVFSDNCTHLLRSTNVTLGFSTSTLGLSTTTMTSKHHNQEMVMVLNRKFPVNSEARGALIIQLKADVRSALKKIAKSADGCEESEVEGSEIEEIDDRHGEVDIDLEIKDVWHDGSVIVHFHFVSHESNTNTNGCWLEEEYLRQIDDKASKLYKGEVTRHIIQKRTQTMTIQLGSGIESQSPCMYQVGGTITLAQVQEEKIECKIESLLGEGATSTVFKVTTNSKICALKVFKAQSSFVDVSEEASILLMANHPQGHSNVLVSSLRSASIDRYNVNSTFCHFLYLDPICNRHSG
jgi:outer membrane protein assembly factor BamD (BamD/ComL family)